MVETRYWKTIGMRVTKDMALEFASRMNLAATYLDEEIEEFTATTHEGTGSISEIETLFANPDEFAEKEEPTDPTVKVILQANAWTKERKARIAELKEEVKDDVLSLKDEEVAEMVENQNLSVEEASERWDEKLKSRCLQEAKIVWDAEFNSRVEAYQAELGLKTE